MSPGKPTLPAQSPLPGQRDPGQGQYRLQELISLLPSVSVLEPGQLRFAETCSAKAPHLPRAPARKVPERIGRTLNGKRRKVPDAQGPWRARSRIASKEQRKIPKKKVSSSLPSFLRITFKIPLVLPGGVARRYLLQSSCCVRLVSRSSSPRLPARRTTTIRGRRT